LIEVDNQILNFPSSLRFCAMPHLVSTSKEKNMDVENSGAQPTGRWLCAGRHEGVEALERDRLPRKGPGIRSRRGCKHRLHRFTISGAVRQRLESLVFYLLTFSSLNFFSSFLPRMELGAVPADPPSPMS